MQDLIAWLHHYWEPQEYCILGISRWSTCLSKSEWAAWLQAIFSVATIWVTMIYARKQVKLAEEGKREAENRHREARLDAEEDLLSQKEKEIERAHRLVVHAAQDASLLLQETEGQMSISVIYSKPPHVGQRPFRFDLEGFLDVRERLNSIDTTLLNKKALDSYRGVKKHFSRIQFHAAPLANTVLDGSESIIASVKGYRNILEQIEEHALEGLRDVEIAHHRAREERSHQRYGRAQV